MKQINTFFNYEYEEKPSEFIQEELKNNEYNYGCDCKNMCRKKSDDIYVKYIDKYETFDIAIVNNFPEKTSCNKNYENMYKFDTEYNELQQEQQEQQEQQQEQQEQQEQQQQQQQQKQQKQQQQQQKQKQQQQQQQQQQEK